jgi:hypothetical protein
MQPGSHYTLEYSISPPDAVQIAKSNICRSNLAQLVTSNQSIANNMGLQWIATRHLRSKSSALWKASTTLASGFN